VGDTEEVPTSLPNLNDCNSEDNHPFASSSFASNLNSVKGTLLVSALDIPLVYALLVSMQEQSCLSKQHHNHEFRRKEITTHEFFSLQKKT